MKLEDGIIELGTDRAKALGFTEDAFVPGSYIWYTDGYVWFSMIIVKEKKQRQGHLKRLVKTIEDQGLKIKIPTPIGAMQAYLKKYGWKKTIEDITLPGGYKDELEVWVRA